MTQSFAEFESLFLGALQQERSDLHGLQGANEAQVVAWIEHLFREYLGYTDWKEITREGSAPIGSKGSKQLFPDLRINIPDSLIFVECKRPGKLVGSKSQEELDAAVSQLKSYVRAHIEGTPAKPKTVLGLATDGNRWHLVSLDRSNNFHMVAEWHFLTDDPRLIAQRLWLLAKPALARPTTALVEFLARNTLAAVLKENTKSLTKKVNEKLPEGFVTEELIDKWLRDALAEKTSPPRHVAPEAAAPPMGGSKQPIVPTSAESVAPHNGLETAEPAGKRIGISELLNAGLLQVQDVLMVEGIEGKQQRASITPDGRISVAGQIFDAVSPAALRALEMVGKVQKAVNGWAAFRVVRGGNSIGTLLQFRSQYGESEHQVSTDGGTQDPQAEDPEEPDPAILSAVEQLKPVLALLPEVTVKTGKGMISLYFGKLVVGYAYPRKTGAPRLRTYVGETCPEWATVDSTYAYWCYLGDWTTNLQQVVTLFKQAPQRRAEDAAAGRDAYTRRAQPPTSNLASTGL